MPVEMGFSPHNAITKSTCLYRHKMCILILDIHCPPYSQLAFTDRIDQDQTAQNVQSGL